MLSAYLRLIIFLLAVLIPACASSSLVFSMMYSAYKLNQQGDNIQPWCTSFPVLNQSVVPSLVLTVASWLAYRFFKRHVRPNIEILSLATDQNLASGPVASQYFWTHSERNISAHTHGSDDVLIPPEYHFKREEGKPEAQASWKPSWLAKQSHFLNIKCSAISQMLIFKQLVTMLSIQQAFRTH